MSGGLLDFRHEEIHLFKNTGHIIDHHLDFEMSYVTAKKL